MKPENAAEVIQRPIAAFGRHDVGMPPIAEEVFRTIQTDGMEFVENGLAEGCSEESVGVGA